MGERRVGVSAGDVSRLHKLTAGPWYILGAFWIPDGIKIIQSPFYQSGSLSLVL